MSPSQSHLIFHVIYLGLRYQFVIMKNLFFFKNSDLGFHFSVARYQDADQEAYFHHPQILVEAFHHILNHCLAHVQLRAWHPQ